MKLLSKYLVILFPIVVFLLILDLLNVYRSAKFIFSKELEQTARAEFALLQKTLFNEESFTKVTLPGPNQVLPLNNNIIIQRIEDKEELVQIKLVSEEEFKILCNKRMIIRSGNLSLMAKESQHESIFLQDKKDGSFLIIRITQDIGHLNQVLKNAFYHTILKIIIFALSFIVTAYIVGTKFIVRPIAALKNHLDKISRGIFASEKFTGPKTEIYDLSQLINNMALKLELYERDLMRSKDEKIKLMEEFRHQDRLKSVGQMAAGVAHELGTPLNVISGRASLIISNDKSSDNQIIHSAKIIKEESQRMTKIIQDLLDFSRKKSDGKASSDLSVGVNKAIELMEYEAQKRGVTLKSNISQPSCLLKISMKDLEHVMINLIKNAIQASSSSGMVIVDELKASDIEIIFNGKIDTNINFGGFAIKDNGCGMTEKIKEEIFNPFFTTKDIGEGTGLGLAVCYGIITDAKGQIHVETAVNKGTTFFVIFPLTRVEG